MKVSPLLLVVTGLALTGARPARAENPLFRAVGRLFGAGGSSDDKAQPDFKPRTGALHRKKSVESPNAGDAAKAEDVQQDTVTLTADQYSSLLSLANQAVQQANVPAPQTQPDVSQQAQYAPDPAAAQPAAPAEIPLMKIALPATPPRPPKSPASTTGPQLRRKQKQ